MLKPIVRGLLINNGSKLKSIKKAQKKFLNPNVAKEIVDFILSIESKGESNIPEGEPVKFWDLKKKINIAPKITLKKKIILKKHKDV